MNPRRLLLVKYRGMGDSVMGLSTLQYLRESFPGTRLFYGVPRWIEPLYRDVRIAADGVIGLDLNGPGGWLRLANRIRRERIDLVYELFQSGRTAKFFRLFSPLLGFEYRFHNHHGKDAVVQAAIQRDLDGACSRVTGGEAPSHLEYPPWMEVPRAGEGNYLILGVVSTRDTKSWPAESFARLAGLLARKFPDLEIRVPLSESDRDAAQGARLTGLGLPAQVKLVRAPLAEIPKLVAGARLYVGNDTGLKHVAVALGVRTVTFFGPESPVEWHPYRPEEHPYFFRDGLVCRTERKAYCDLTACESLICLKEISPEGVFPVVEEALGR